jgi:Protein of unknown function (DUF3575)
MKKSLLIIALILSGASMQAQSWGDGETEKQNIVKFNVYGPIFRNFPFQYERLLPNKKSICLGLRFMPNGVFPGLSSFKNFINSGQSVQDTAFNNLLDGIKLSGFAITPEFRFYFGAESGKGFYLGPMLRYENFAVSFPTRYEISNNQTRVFDFTGRCNSLGFGAQLGAQWHLGSNITLDWSFVGGYVRWNTLSIAVTSNDFGLSQQDLDQIRTDVNADLTTSNPFSYKLTTLNNQKIEFTGNSLGLSMRTALSLGFRF